MSVRPRAVPPATGLPVPAGRGGAVVVVGSGVAGLSAALALAPRSVILVTKTDFGGGASRWAQGGIAAAVGPGDRPELHARDTLAAGAGLCDPDVVAAVTSEGPARIDDLLALGARFDRDARGRLQLGREGAHGRRRVLHADGDATGAEIVRVLTEAVRTARHVRVLERTFAGDLQTEGDRVVGVSLHHGSVEGPISILACSAVILATGGFGQLYLHTTNPVESTGDGLAMAARAGAVVADLEMVQFHPTALAVSADPRPLVTEALRGEGALLLDDRGRRFVLDVDERGELAPRDIVARAIHALARTGQTARLDATGCVGEAFPERFPTVWAACREHGIDPRVRPIPVTPAAHYAMAGVATDEWGRTSLEGLWACGEVSSSGLHGANRLASNSLLEGLVIGARVGVDVGRSVPEVGGMPLPDLGRLPDPTRSGEGTCWDGPGGTAESVAELRRRIRTVMWDRVGLVRSEEGLETAERELAELASRVPGSGETANLALIGRMVASAARTRRESCGAHFRSDAPGRALDVASRSFWRVLLEGDDVRLEPAARPVERRMDATRSGEGRRAIA